MARSMFSHTFFSLIQLVWKNIHFVITGYNTFTVVCKHFFHAMKSTENEEPDTKIRDIVESTHMSAKRFTTSTLEENYSDI